MLNINRIILIVLDSVGVGELPDAFRYSDVGSNTLKHIFEQSGKDFVLENMGKLGLYNIVPSPYGYIPKEVVGCYGKMATLSPAKDTTAGHWEIAGIVLDKPFPTYPDGFPKELIEEFKKQTGTNILGNCVASGTEIIKKLGQQHYDTGFPIVYTSADSVFQIAAAEDSSKFGGLKRLYEICDIARNLLQGEHAVGRVIARPFIRQQDGTFKRTTNRKDYSLTPPQTTILDKIKNNDGNVIAVGKIKDIFNNRGIVTAYHTIGNPHGIQLTIDSIKNLDMEEDAISFVPNKKSFEKQLIFTNLVDFDMLWGHRRNVGSYAQSLKFFDERLSEIMSSMKEKDLLIITADHGCDPTYTKHTDHTREYVPLMVYGKQIKQNVNLGTRKSLADIAQTIADIFELEPMKNGTSFKNEII